MNAGYVRLSRDDDKRNYVSIENQKLIITQYAKKHGITIDCWYEDDGFSGYKFDRPAFNKLMENLNNIDTVLVKDFSRLGRHNAKVLLLLDEFQERGKELIVIDDNYNSLNEEDDTIGIKTWYNERYIKDTSKKIKCAITAKQKEGTLKTKPPFGYKKNKTNDLNFEIVSEEAKYIKLIYSLYIEGLGYRKLANYLTAEKIPTPSMCHHKKELKENRITHNKIVTKWSDSMVKEILDNDFYIGTFRLKKRTRHTVHGKNKRVPKNEQFTFENHHPAIIDKDTFYLVQDLKKKRNRNISNNSSKQWSTSKTTNPFANILFCKDCGKSLTPIKRKTSNKERKYYICSTYNTKGKRFCPKAHLIEENDLITDIINYIKLCRNILYKTISSYEINNLDKSTENDIKLLKNSITEAKFQLKVLLSEKIKDLSNACENKNIITESYSSVENDILNKIHKLELQLQDLKNTSIIKNEPKNAIDILDKIIANGTLTNNDIKLLIEKIEVDENGFPEIKLKCGLLKLTNHKTNKNNLFLHESMD